jgi:hypothetical protein
VFDQLPEFRAWGSCDREKEAGQTKIDCLLQNCIGCVVQEMGYKPQIGKWKEDLVYLTPFPKNSSKGRQRQTHNLATKI